MSPFHSTIKMVAEDLVGQFDDLEKGEPVFCYTGLSGITNATMIAYLVHQLNKDLPVHHIYVRKQGEKSHGDEVECSMMVKSYSECRKWIPIFVDDFIDEGDTVNYVMTRARKYMGNYCPAFCLS